MAINIGSFVGPMIAPLLSGGTSDGVPNLLGYDKRSCGGNAVTIDVTEGRATAIERLHAREGVAA